MDKDKLLQGVPLLVLIITLIYTVIKGVFINSTFSWQLQAGIISTAICVVLYFARLTLYKYVFAFVLVLGSFNFLHFTLNEVTVDFSLALFNAFNLKTIEFQVFSLFVLLLFLIINRRQLKKMVRNILSALMS